MSQSQGTLDYACELYSRSDNKTGMEYIKARYEAINFYRCWMANRFHWDMVNRHVWRFLAMYEGGDCFLAGWEGTRPHDSLWSLTHNFGKKYGMFRKAHMTKELLLKECRELHARRHKKLLQKSTIESIIV